MVRGAARLLEFSGIDELETVLADIQKPLVFLAAADVLSEVSFHLHDVKGISGATATFDPYDAADFEDADLSPLRLLANPDGRGSLRIVCLDSALAQSIVGTDWLPPSSATLECTQVNLHENGMDSKRFKEDNDEYNDGQDAGQYFREISKFYGYLNPSDRIQD
jgi:hypothetical protein